MASTTSFGNGVLTRTREDVSARPENAGVALAQGGLVDRGRQVRRLFAVALEFAAGLADGGEPALDRVPRHLLGAERGLVALELSDPQPAASAMNSREKSGAGAAAGMGATVCGGTGDVGVGPGVIFPAPAPGRSRTASSAAW